MLRLFLRLFIGSGGMALRSFVLNTESLERGEVFHFYQISAVVMRGEIMKLLCRIEI